MLHCSLIKDTALKHCPRLQPQQSLHGSPHEKHSLQEEKAGHSLSVIQPCARHRVYARVLNNSSAITTCQMPPAKPQTAPCNFSVRAEQAQQVSEGAQPPKDPALAPADSLVSTHATLETIKLPLSKQRRPYFLFFFPRQSNISKSWRGYAFSRKDSRRSFAKGRRPQHLIREEDGTAQKHTSSRYGKREKSRAEMQAKATRG